MSPLLRPLVEHVFLYYLPNLITLIVTNISIIPNFSVVSSPTACLTTKSSLTFCKSSHIAVEYKYQKHIIYAKEYIMSILMRSKSKELLSSISELAEADYGKTSAELEHIYRRLTAGRVQFEDVMSNIFASLMQISSLDLALNHHSKLIQQISDSVSAATELIHQASSEAASVSSTVSAQHEDLTNTIIAVSEASGSVYQKIDEGQQELTATKSLSDNTIAASREMQQDMNQLSDIISQMNNVIAGINSISSQTNLLALNASIEAARAGEAGKGFAVVAEEIRQLADETQKLTASMGHFVTDIHSASEKSVKSVDMTIESLQTVTQKISHVWELNEDNRNNVETITNNISSLASLSEEISSSIIELESRSSDIEGQCGVLHEDMTKLQAHGRDIDNIAAPLENIEAVLDESAKIMGTMAKDAFYKLENKNFAEYIDKAINAHKNWLGNLEQIVRKKTILPLQINDRKCGFGHFYYAMNPTNPEVIQLWKELGEKHKKFHSYGKQALDALFNEDYSQAEHIYEEAVQYSKTLIQEMEAVKKVLTH